MGRVMGVWGWGGGGGVVFFFNDTATTEIYTLSLHDALPISYGTVPLQQRLAFWIVILVVPWAVWETLFGLARRALPKTLGEIGRAHV